MINIHVIQSLKVCGQITKSHKLNYKYKTSDSLIHVRNVVNSDWICVVFFFGGGGGYPLGISLFMVSPEMQLHHLFWGNPHFPIYYKNSSTQLKIVRTWKRPSNGILIMKLMWFGYVSTNFWIFLQFISDKLNIINEPKVSGCEEPLCR